MKKTIQAMLFVCMLGGSVVAAGDVDYVAEGCKDIMKNRSTQNSGFVIGIATGTNMLGEDVLNAMNFKTFQVLDGQDIKSACKTFFDFRSRKEYDNWSSNWIFSFLLRGDLIRANGHKWDEVQERKKFMRRASGFEDTRAKNKKY